MKLAPVTPFKGKPSTSLKGSDMSLVEAYYAKRPTNTDFIQWYIFTFHGEQISTERLERAYKEYAANN